MMSGRYRELNWWWWVGFAMPLALKVVPLLAAGLAIRSSPTALGTLIDFMGPAMAVSFALYGIWFCTVIPILEARYLKRRPVDTRPMHIKVIRLMPWMGVGFVVLFGTLAAVMPLAMDIFDRGAVTGETWRSMAMFGSVLVPVLINVLVVKRITRQPIADARNHPDIYCRVCGYCLHAALPTHGCPECGETIHPEDRRALSGNAPAAGPKAKGLWQVRKAWYFWVGFAVLLGVGIALQFGLSSLSDAVESQGWLSPAGLIAGLCIVIVSFLVPFGLSGDRKLKIYGPGRRMLPALHFQLSLPALGCGLMLFGVTLQQAFLFLALPSEWSVDSIRVPFTLCGLGLIASAIYLKRMRPFIEKRFRAMIRERNLCFECGGTLSAEEPGTCPECGEAVVG